MTSSAYYSANLMNPALLAVNKPVSLVPTVLRGNAYNPTTPGKHPATLRARRSCPGKLGDSTPFLPLLRAVVRLSALSVSPYPCCVLMCTKNLAKKRRFWRPVARVHPEPSDWCPFVSIRGFSSQRIQETFPNHEWTRMNTNSFGKEEEEEEEGNLTTDCTDLVRMGIARGSSFPGPDYPCPSVSSVVKILLLFPLVPIAAPLWHGLPTAPLWRPQVSSPETGIGSSPKRRHFHSGIQPRGTLHSPSSQSSPCRQSRYQPVHSQPRISHFPFARRRAFRALLGLRKPLVPP